VGGAGKGGSQTNSISLYETAVAFTFIGGPGGAMKEGKKREGRGGEGRRGEGRGGEGTI